MIKGPAEVWGACPEAARPGLMQNDAYREDCNHVRVADGERVPLTRAGLAAAGIREPPSYLVPKRRRDGAHVKVAPHLHVRSAGPDQNDAWREIPYPDALLQDLPPHLVNSVIAGFLDCGSLESLCRVYKCDRVMLDRAIGLHGLPLVVNRRALEVGSAERVRLACALELNALRLDEFVTGGISVAMEGNSAVVSWETPNSRYEVQIYRSRQSRRVVERLWYRDGRWHRDGDRPAVEEFFDVGGDESRRVHQLRWYRHGQMHRDGDRPAIESFFNVDGDESRRIHQRVWIQDGQTHRDGDRPALEEFFDVDGDESRRVSKRVWYRDGQMHRDGDRLPVEEFLNVDAYEGRGISQRLWYRDGHNGLNAWYHA